MKWSNEAGLWLVAVVIVTLLAGFMFLADLGGLALTDRDEGEYAATVGEMVRSGDYLVPTLNGRNYLEKPILVFWAIAGAQAVFGPGELAARLPSALPALAVILLVGALAWRYGGLALGVLAAAACAFTPLFVLVGRASLTDMLLTLWTTGALAAFFVAVEEQEPGRRRWWYLAAWAALGLGFLTKGPVAPAVVLPTALIYALCQRRLWPVLKTAQIHWGLLIFLVINLPWYGLVFLRLGGEFWDAFFVAQNLRRFSEVLLGHGGGFLLYPPVMLLGGFPFVAVALPELGRALGRNPTTARAQDPLARLRLLAAIAALVVLVVFSLAATKQINYILPAFPFLALLAGCYLLGLWQGQAGGRLARGVFWGALGVSGGLMTVAVLALPAGLPLFWDKIVASIRFDSSEYALPEAAPLVVLWPILLGLTLGALLVGAWLAWRRGRLRLIPPILASGALLGCAMLFFGLLPQVAQAIQEPAKQMALALKERAPADRVVSYGLWKPTMIFYLDRQIPRLRVEQQQELAVELAKAEPVWLLSRVALAQKLAAAPGFVELGRWGGYLLGGNQAASARWRQGQAAPAGPAGPAAPGGPS